MKGPPKINTTLRYRLLSIGVAALVGILAFGGFALVEKGNVASEMTSLNELAKLGPIVSALVHELQKERGASTGFAGSRGMKFGQKLSAQRKETNQKSATLFEALGEFNATAFGESFVGKVKAAQGALARLENERDQVDGLSKTVPEIATYYGNTIASLLSIVEEMAVLSTNADITSAITAYTTFLQAKERAGIERAMGSGGFGAGEFTPVVYRQFVQLIAVQETFLGIFRNYATGAQKVFYDSTVTGEAVDEVNRMRKVAIESVVTGDTKGIDGRYWFDTITTKIDQLKMVENKIAADLRALTGARQSEARTGVYIVAVLAGLLILITLGLVHTIFEHRRADVALHESEEKFRNLFEYANDGIFIIDPASRRFLDANAIALERLGYTRDELLELSVDAFDTDDDDGAGKEFVRQILKAGGLVFERTHLSKDGSELPSEVSARVVEYGDRTVIQSFVRDITERKQGEEQLRRAQRMEAIGQLTGGVAHDFNNLLAIILGNAELLNERLGGDSLAESVIRAADRGGELTQRLLAFSRRQPLQPKITDLSALVVDMEELLLRTLGETIKIETANAVGLWTTEADPGQIENALLNFANNARDAMPKGGTLTIEAGNVTLDNDSAARVGTVPGDYVVLAVADTGSGMPPEVLEYVFEPFFSTKDVGEGSGLGLSMAYGFAKQSGGSLQIESELDGGTIVRMYLPRANGPRANGSIAATEENARLPEERYEGNGNILVVEDDPDVRSLVVQILGDLGYQTTEAESGVAALTLLEDGRKFDLLFTDVVMPGGISGPELFRKTRTRFPDLKVIFTSGYNDETIGNSAQVKVQAPLVRKPYRKSDLGRIVREVLSNTG